MSAPLTPPECDLQDFPFMPLHVARLRDSDLANTAHPEACWYAVLLWSAAWHQLPAASLPDDDAILTRLIGLGRDVRAFRKHKAEAMRGFVLCSDGRLYHPTVAEQAMAAWESKLQQRWRTELARIKKANQRNGTDLPSPSYEQWLEALSPAPGDPSPPVVPGDTGECPPGQGLQGTGTGTGRLYSEDKSSGAIRAVVDHDKTAWDAAVILLTDHGGLTEKQARAYFGKLLATNGLEPRDLLPAITAAMVKGSQDPQGYLSAAASGIAKRRTPAVAQRVGFV